MTDDRVLDFLERLIVQVDSLATYPYGWCRVSGNLEKLNKDVREYRRSLSDTQKVDENDTAHG